MQRLKRDASLSPVPNEHRTISRSPINSLVFSPHNPEVTSRTPKPRSKVFIFDEHTIKSPFQTNQMLSSPMNAGSATSSSRYGLGSQREKMVYVDQIVKELSEKEDFSLAKRFMSKLSEQDQQRHLQKLCTRIESLLKAEKKLMKLEEQKVRNSESKMKAELQVRKELNSRVEKQRKTMQKGWEQQKQKMKKYYEDIYRRIYAENKGLVKQLQRNNEALQQGRDFITQDRAKYQKILRSVLSQIKSLKIQCKQLHEYQRELSQQHQKFTNRIGQLLQQSYGHQKREQSLAELCQELEGRLRQEMNLRKQEGKRYEQLIEGLRTRVGQQDKREQEWECRVRQLTRTVFQHQIEKEDRNRQAEGKKGYINCLQQERKNLEGDIKILTNQIKQRRQEEFAISETVRLKAQELEEVAEGFKKVSQQKQQAQIQCNEAQELKVQMREEIQNLTRQIAQKQQEVKDLKEQVEQQQQNVSDLKEKQTMPNDSARPSFQPQTTSQPAHKDELAKQILQMGVEKAQLTAELSQMKMTKSGLQEDIHKKLDELVILESDIEVQRIALSKSSLY